LDTKASDASAVDLRNVTKRFGPTTAVSDLTLSIKPGEFFCLLGPSGCGKTTLLRLIAGLEDVDEGEVRISGVDQTKAPPEKRPVNTVFQSYALFPHLSVYDNIAFGLKIRKRPAAEITERCERIMKLVEVTELARRLPSEISGGQKQRVALARALVNEPEVLLLDEPLAAIDQKLRKQLQIGLRHLQRTLRKTFLHVTHDQDEAMFLSDRIALMRAGNIEQIGTPQELYSKPRTRFAAEFFGACNLLAVVRSENGKAITKCGEFQVVDPVKAFLAVRPESVRIVRQGEIPKENSLQARVDEVLFAGATREYRMHAGEQTLQVVEMNSGEAALSVGECVTLHIPPAGLIVLHDSTHG
jgi:spermidine/putrescine transport system ATP-binding protein